MLFRAVLALSVTFGDTSPKGRGFGKPHRFLYLFGEVYAILVLRFIPPILLGKGGVPDDSYPHDFGVCRSRCNVALHLQVA